MKFNHLRRFVAVAERGSMRSAARELGIPQPVITRSIQELERELGVQLFERSINGIVLTPIAEKILRRAKVMETEMERTLEEVDQYKGKEVGTLTIGLSSGAHVGILPKVLAPFRKRYPKVRIKVVEGLFPKLETDIRDGIIELYVGPIPRERFGADLTVDLLFENQRIIVGRQGHPLSQATSIMDLKDAQWVATPVMMDSENEVNAIYTAVDMPPPNIVAQASSGLSILSIVASSDLLAPLPHLWSDFISSTKFACIIPIKQTTFSPPICVARQSRLLLSPPGQFFTDLVHRVAVNHKRSLVSSVESGGTLPPPL
ncbi:LysR family transcriptional regulator [Novosphingobium terrae]|uniref:LysR family transcriptional regulator n=1 Tax=Novosphingobium terrae TaxID=2726189 RepID=UPI00197F4B80|nr:LysR family transcriptional regulator [Novosphingobium terrae]